ncbi:MAG: C25 family cysteine peptidase [Bacteroidales bacterium]|nr:C25 family cysteine peptidase [Bacteroidales bacterium]
MVFIVLLFFPFKGRCDIVVSPSNGITVTITDSSYIIEYYGNDFQELLDTTSNLTFSKIHFLNDSLGLYHEKDSMGRPMLPFRPLDLQLPADANNIRIETHVLDSSHNCLVGFSLQKPYFPYQDYYEETTIHTLSYDTAYYTSSGSDWYQKWYDISEPYLIYGATGIRFNIVPVIYSPLLQTASDCVRNHVRVASHLSFTIKFNGSSLLDLMDDYLTGVYSEDAVLFFDNYKGQGREFPTLKKGRYVILTQPRHVQTLQQFVSHKTSLGYIVDVYANDYAALGATGTRNFLKGLYDDPNKRPRFVLLVGNHEEIPMSAGTWESLSNPPTDIYYACLNYSNICTEDNDLTPSVHVGRWPVFSDSEIKNIVEKTMKTELALYSENKTRLTTQAFSGTGNNQRSFRKSLQEVRDQVFSHTPLVYILEDGMNPSGNPSLIINQKMANDTWMFLYRGHGGYNQLGNPYYYGPSSISSLNQQNVSYYPFCFAFTCNTGGYAATNTLFYKSFSYYITCYKDVGAISHFGSSVESLTIANNKSQLSVFSELLDIRNRTITSMTINGMSKYFLDCKTFVKRRQVKKYNFFGDPSVYIYGINPNSENQRVSPNPNSDSDNSSCRLVFTMDSEVLVDLAEEVRQIDVVNAVGAFVASVNSNRIKINTSALTDGIYFLLIQTTSNKQITEKLIVKH